jgi:3-polyprenyl-4-hydroxybenzoate decarboxylase
VDLDDDENLQWGIFTRFDPARDMIFSEQRFAGARPVYRGIVGSTRRGSAATRCRW